MQAREMVASATEYLRQHQPEGWKPRAALVLGSGLSHIAAALSNAVVIDYQDIPHFIRSNVEGHEGQLHMGWLGGAPTICLQGRQHLYEDPASPATKVAMRTLRALGTDILFLTAAAGSLNRYMTPGSLMLVADHINMTGLNPLTGPNDDAIGERFPAMDHAYDPVLRRWLTDIAIAENITLNEGIYVGMLGPNFETPAEVRMLQMLGGDAVGMSVVHETLLARHCGMRVATCAAITNMAEGLSSGGSLSHDETLQAAETCSEALTRLLFGFFESLG